MDLRGVRRLEKQTLTEQELVEGCRRGDDVARRQLYERYAGKMMAICMRYMGNREEAEDLLHDGYIKLYGSFDKFDWQGEGTLPAWMARVMANLALQRLRKNDVMSQTVELENTAELRDDVDRPDEGPDIETIPKKVLMQFIEELPPGYRTVFNMHVFEGKNHIEIGKELGINNKSSASQLVRARAILKERVNEWRRQNGL
ncbi:MAG: sigma-70 family RNA polymerase sigma factor [Bacteroidaceae bacterium]|nr:sigma-70 family RNA polymerase sigma factor [Bacteroidaceae bacterium]